MIVFVFGSNLAGRHGAGAARHAREYYGALQGLGEGFSGQSYALPTKDKDLKSLPLDEIEKNIKKFKDFARSRPDLLFLVTAIGCGLAGYKHEHIAPAFRNAPGNCFFDKRWAHWLA